MMNRFFPVLPAALTFLSTIAMNSIAIGAENPDARLCNLQGREIALRISEEVNSALSAEARNQIVEIAEQVCQDYAGQSGSYTVIQRPGPNEAAGLSVNASEDNSLDSEATENGLFGEMKIIEPEDRVRRPGLKRR
ncbi:MAG: hypothetical protein HOH14_04270 [Gammaproteobacteria bacterium]|jgi:hypothetical protein|nr:hypothetical protein [Gammaproteobacteria bacterium]